MKKLFRVLGIIIVAAIIARTIVACDFLDEPSPTNKTPVASDYDVGNLIQSVGNTIIAVTITPRANKSPGGVNNIKYAGNATLPTAAGSYAVTFDVAAATGWNAATGLNAGTLTIGTLTPVAEDFIISKTIQTVGSVTAVTITPKVDKSTGAIKIYYAGTGSTTYEKSETVPTSGTSGAKYAITFDVAAVAGWSEAKGLSGGTLELTDNKTPEVNDYNISGTGIFTYDGKERKVTVEKKDANRSPGDVTVKYNDGTTAPSAAGTYIVTFDVAAATGWNAATGLPAGNLVINTAPTLSVTILGTPQVGKILTADVVKNFSGENKYQWLRDNQAIQGEVYSQFVPEPIDSGKAISVKVTCGDKSATSPAVTIQPVAYTVEIGRGYDWLYAYIKIGDSYLDWDPDGFSIKWYRNGNNIPDETDWGYYLQAADAGKKIQAKVSGYNQTVTSNEFQVEASDTTRLKNTTWKAEDEDEEEGDKYIYTLKFTSATAWTMDLYKTDTETGNVFENIINGTYAVLYGYVFLDCDNGEREIGTIYSYNNTICTIYFDDLTFYKQ